MKALEILDEDAIVSAAGQAENLDGDTDDRCEIEFDACHELGLDYEEAFDDGGYEQVVLAIWAQELVPQLRRLREQDANLFAEVLKRALLPENG